ncbi:sensor histidine kinase [Sphingomonas jaspsi]|uniref:sensor histidine kinase n=1 Tax=Sphingomonas jaspsi TaxID=392409 RepID=UPI0004B77D5B|nr:ATP-binding protein [Sphingomonas jaspsi]
MASRPSDTVPVTGRTDRDGRLVEADPPLRRLQEEAGSAMGRPIALPQLAAIVRTALRLGVPLSRSVIAASASEDLDLWVRAVPDIDGVAISIEGWQARPAAGPRLTLIAGGKDLETAETAGDQVARMVRVDGELRVQSIDPELSRLFGPDAQIGRPLTRAIQLVEDEDGTMPLLGALGARQDFDGQLARLRSDSRDELRLSGTVVANEAGRFEGFDIKVDLGGPASLPVDEAPSDPALDAALRSPLDQIIAAAERIVDRSDGPLRSDYAAYASDIAAAGRHLLSVLRSMSDDPGAVAADKVDLVALSREAVSLVSADAAASGVEFELEEHEGALDARGEPRAILQILVNILGNAVRHSPQGGTVAIVFDEDGGKAQVTVADQGPGIDRRDQQRIFERYEQGSAPGSAGLGLAISRRLARTMDGDVTLESAPGEGARFTLSLPRL